MLTTPTDTRDVHIASVLYSYTAEQNPGGPGRSPASGRSTPWPDSVRQYQRRLARFEIGDYATDLPRPVPDRLPALT